MRTKYLTLALLAIGLAACTNDEMENISAENNEAIFTGSIESVRTRAYDQTWEINDPIGITGTSGNETYTNVCYKNTETNPTTFEPEGDIIYYKSDAPVEFKAYYPWKTELTTSETYTFNTQDQSQQKQFDFLHATGTGSKGTAVDFSFTHKMSKLKLILKGQNSMTYNEVKGGTYSLGNLALTGTFDRTDGSVEAGTPAEQPWTFSTPTGDYKQEDDINQQLVYTLILAPQTFEITKPLTFTATIEGNTYSATIDLSTIANNNSENALKPGTQYDLTVNVNKMGLSISACIIYQWDSNTGDFTAEIQ